MREIYIRKTEGLDIAVVEDGRLVEYLPEDGSQAPDFLSFLQT